MLFIIVGILLCLVEKKNQFKKKNTNNVIAVGGLPE